MESSGNTASFSYMDNRFPLELNFESRASDAVDYYVLYGPEMDQIIQEYRRMTGHAPMFPEWAYGLFQSKDRYSSQAEILNVAGQYRARHIPMDAIVQDWYWWGSQVAKAIQYSTRTTPMFRPNLKELHNEHVQRHDFGVGKMDGTSKTFSGDPAKRCRDW